MKRISAFVEAAIAVTVVSGFLAALWVLSVFEVEQDQGGMDGTDQVERLLASVWEGN